MLTHPSGLYKTHQLVVNPCSFIPTKPRVVLLKSWCFVDASFSPGGDYIERAHCGLVQHRSRLIFTQHARATSMARTTKCRDIRMRRVLFCSPCLCSSLFGELSEEFSNLFCSSPQNGHMHTVQVISCHGDSVWQHTVHWEWQLASISQSVCAMKDMA